MVICYNELSQALFHHGAKVITYNMFEAFICCFEMAPTSISQNKDLIMRLWLNHWGPSQNDKLLRILFF